MATVHTSSLIAAPVERVWEFVRDFNALPKWFPGVTDSYIEPGINAGEPGCIRNFGLPGSLRVREQLVAHSDQDRTWNYKMIEGPLPVSNYSATVRFSSADGKGTLAEITSNFDCSPAQEQEMIAFLGSTYQGAFDLLKKHFSQA